MLERQSYSEIKQGHLKKVTVFYDFFEDKYVFEGKRQILGENKHLQKCRHKSPVLES